MSEKVQGDTDHLTPPTVTPTHRCSTGGLLKFGVILASVKGSESMTHRSVVREHRDSVWETTEASS